MVGYSPWGRKESDTSEWLTVDLQSCVNFCCRAKWFSYICIFFFFILFSIIVFLRILNISVDSIFSVCPIPSAYERHGFSSSEDVGSWLWGIWDRITVGALTVILGKVFKLKSFIFFFFSICNIGWNQPLADLQRWKQLWALCLAHSRHSVTISFYFEESLLLYKLLLYLTSFWFLKSPNGVVIWGEIHNWSYGVFVFQVLVYILEFFLAQIERNLYRLKLKICYFNAVAWH